MEGSIESIVCYCVDESQIPMNLYLERMNLLKDFAFDLLVNSLDILRRTD